MDGSQAFLLYEAGTVYLLENLTKHHNEGGATSSNLWNQYLRFSGQVVAVHSRESKGCEAI
jgi:hypothetical protein